MPFVPGDRVHIPRLGTGVVCDIRSGGRLVVEIKGRKMVVDAAQVEWGGREPAPPRAEGSDSSDASAPLEHVGATIDLHGKTVHEAIEAVDRFINDAVLAAHAHVRIIHGRSGGRLRDAVHKRLRMLAPVKSFRLDPRNPGVTIVSL